MRTWVALAGLLLACADDASLRVDLRTDLVPNAEIDRVVVEFDGDVLEHEVDVSANYVDGVRVAQFDGVGSGSRRGDLIAYLGATEVVRRPFSVHVSGNSGVTVVVTRDCRGVACPGAGGDLTAIACLGGRCVDDRCTEETPENCDEPECAIDSECVTTAACAVGRCLAGTCLFEGSGCAETEYCDAERGCLARPTDGPGAITVENLGVAWATPNAIRWTWDLGGNDADFRELRVELGASADSVDRIVGAFENAELGVFRITERDLTQSTVTHGHEPDSTVFGRVIAIDSQGRTRMSDRIEARTPSPAVDAIEVFADAETSGYSIPASFVRSDSDPFMGSHAYEATHVCESGTECWEIYRRQALELDLSAIPEDRAAGAYVEWAAQFDADSHYSSVRLWLGDGGRLHQAEGFAYRGDGAYRVYQWPLSALIDAGEGIDHAGLEPGLHEFGIGGQFPVGTVIRWDEVRIRY